MRRVDCRGCYLGALFSLGCSGQGSLDGARVGEGGASAQVRVGRELVAEVQRARGLSAERALSLAVEDALLATELARREPILAGWIERLALARGLLGALGDAAKAEGPPSDVEVLELSEQRFWELARPRMVQVAHAVVLAPEERAEARALAERILAAVQSVQSASEFQSTAEAVSTGGQSVKVELLPPVTLDGRAVDPERPPPAGPPVQSFDAVFAAAVHRLERAGQLSPVVRTPFGYHVLYHVKSFEPLEPSVAERKQLLYDEIMAQRARALQSELLAAEREAASPSQERSALSSMEGVGVSR